MKNVLKISALALVAFLFAFTNANKKTILIDVSHGGKDSGALVEGFNEKEIALSIAKKMKELNQHPNVEIILTRESDTFLSLAERAKLINDLHPDYVISLHTNVTTNPSVSGMNIVISDQNTEREKSGELAMDLLYSFDKKNIQINKADYYLLKNVHYPIAFIELGYLSNESDRQLLTTQKGQQELAESILNGIK